LAVAVQQLAERRSAIAALALGIIGVVFTASGVSHVFALICGVLGLGYGLRGRRNVTAPGVSSGGLVTAAIVLGCVVIALGLPTSFGRNRIGTAFSSPPPTTQIGPVDADPTANKVRVTSCYRDRSTQAPAAAGTLVNTSGRAQAFRVTIAFPYPDTPTVFGTGFTGEVSPGGSASWTARDLAESFPPRSCKAVRATAGSQ
jgi:hypothetical protein